VKTPLRERAGMPTGKTHRIGGWFLSDSVASLAKPKNNKNRLQNSDSSHTSDNIHLCMISVVDSYYDKEI